VSCEHSESTSIVDMEEIFEEVAGALCQTTGTNIARGRRGGGYVVGNA